MSEILKEMLGAKVFREEMAKTRATIANGLMGLNLDFNGSVMTFARIKEILNAGKGKSYFDVGDQITVEKENSILVTPSNDSLSIAFTEATFLEKEHEAGNIDYVFTYTADGWKDNHGSIVDLSEYGIVVTGTPSVDDTITVHESASELVFDIAHVENDKLTLVMHDAFISMQFDAQEAKWAAADGSQLPAGKYKISSTLSFTATQPFYCAKPSNTTLSTSVTVTTYGANRTSVESGLAIVADVTDCDGDLTASGCENHNDRVNYGSNNYMESAIRQYLNGTGSGWWSPQTKWDLRPSNHAGTPFMHGIDPAFLDVLSTENKVWKDNTNGTYGNTGAHNFEDKFFLLCSKDVNFSTDADESDTRLALFTNGLSASDNSTDQNNLRKKIVGSGYGYWWLRTAYRGTVSHAIGVNASGYRGNYGANYSGGVVPACVISADSAEE